MSLKGDDYSQAADDTDEAAATSAQLKQALKMDPVTPELERWAERFPIEADEAYFEALAGALYAPGSWVAGRLQSPTKENPHAR